MKHVSRDIVIKYFPTIICSLMLTSTTFAAMNTHAAELFKILPRNNAQQVKQFFASNNVTINSILPLNPPYNPWTGTALQYACILNTQNNYLGVIEVLLSHPNINVKQESEKLSPPLHIAAHNGQVKLARLILAKEPKSVEFTDKFGRIALHCAAAQNHTKMMTLLSARGSNVNARTHHGSTPLHFAVQNPWYNPIKFLIDRKADISVRNNSNANPFASFIPHIDETRFRDQIVDSFLQATPQRIPYRAFRKALSKSQACPPEVIDLILQLYYRITEEKILEIATTNGIHYRYVKDLCHPKYIDLI